MFDFKSIIILLFVNTISTFMALRAAVYLFDNYAKMMFKRFYIKNFRTKTLKDIKELQKQQYYLIDEIFVLRKEMNQLKIDIYDLSTSPDNGLE